MKTLKSMRLHIAILGKTNTGKSSLLNKITNQDVSIVSKVAGTTTDVVEKSMELLPIGPVTFLDTAGINDMTELSEQRIDKTFKVLNRTDVAVIVTDYNGFDDYETGLIKILDDLKIPYMVIVNKTDEKMVDENDYNYINAFTDNILVTSALKDDELVFKFKEMLVKLLPNDYINAPKIVGDLVEKGSTVILVIPIDKEAPKGRIILPQVQTIRDLLDNDCLCYVVKETELEKALENLKTPPSLVVTDSQAFQKVSDIVPENIPLTSFSILFARIKGDLEEFVKGAKAIENLQDGDKVLILESCTHHAIEDDIGRVKIPNWLRKKTGKNIVIENYAGHDFPGSEQRAKEQPNSKLFAGQAGCSEDSFNASCIEDYKLIIHCGACMTNRREVLSRILIANDKKVPITNYGIVISYCLGILPRAIEIFNKT